MFASLSLRNQNYGDDVQNCDLFHIKVACTGNMLFDNLIIRDLRRVPVLPSCIPVIAIWINTRKNGKQCILTFLALSVLTMCFLKILILGGKAWNRIVRFFDRYLQLNSLTGKTPNSYEGCATNCTGSQTLGHVKNCTKHCGNLEYICLSAQKCS